MVSILGGAVGVSEIMAKPWEGVLILSWDIPPHVSAFFAQAVL